jgi:hypothetical protein
MKSHPGDPGVDDSRFATIPQIRIHNFTTHHPAHNFTTHHPAHNFITMASAHAQPPAPPAAVPPKTIRIKRPRDEVPVSALVVNEPTSKKPRTDNAPTPDAAPAYVFRLSHTLSKFQPVPAEGLVRKVPSLEGSRKRLSSFDLEAMRAAESEEDIAKRRKIAPVRKYQLSKKARHSPYGGSPRHGAVFERVRDEEMKEALPIVKADVETGKGEEMKEALPIVKADVETGKGALEEPKKERKRPRTHPKEKEMLKERREKGDDKLTLGYEDDEILMKKMERMVLDYLNADTNDGIKNLPPSQPAAKDKIGGGVGGGTWQGDKDKDTTMTEDEDEEGYVYDVYFREEVTAENAPQPEGESYGVIVFAESEDEAWWYEGADEEDDRSDVYGSDDEDSNGLPHNPVSKTGPY